MIKHKQRFQSWLPALFDGQFHWDFLLPAWKGTKVQPMDFDMVVERYGHVLICETKIAGKGIDLGQAITLTDQWKKGATIFQIQGKSPETINALKIYWPQSYKADIKVGDLPLKPCDAFDVVFYARAWFCNASGWPVLGREEWDRELWLWDHEK